MLVFFCILVIVFTMVLLLYYSSIRIEIKKLKIDTTKKQFVTDYKINIYLAFLNKIKYLKISIYKEKIEKIKNLNFNKIKEKIRKLKMFNSLKEKGIIKNINLITKSIKSLHINLEKLDLRLNIGIENIVVLSYLISILNILMSILLSRKTIGESNYKDLIKRYKYIIVPKQTKKWQLKSNIKAEISLKISNIIKTSCNLKKIQV